MAVHTGPAQCLDDDHWNDYGVVELSPFEFLDRIADLVPPPRKHRHRLPP